MNFIKKLFGRKKKISEDETDDLVSIKYSVTREGDVEIHLEWQSDGLLNSEWLGELIAAIHSGSLDTTVLDILSSHAEQSPEDGAFIAGVINTWAEVTTKIHLSNLDSLLTNAEGASVVLPSEVFGAYKKS